MTVVEVVFCDTCRISAERKCPIYHGQLINSFYITGVLPLEEASGMCLICATWRLLVVITIYSNFGEHAN